MATPTSPYMDPVTVGTDSGEAPYNGWCGISKFRFSFDQNTHAITSYQFVWTNGTITSGGWGVGEYSYFELTGGEVLTQFIMWPSSSSVTRIPRVGGILMRTSEGNTFQCGEVNGTSGTGAVDVPVGSGIIGQFGAGFSTDDQGELWALTFYFYKPILSMAVSVDSTWTNDYIPGGQYAGQGLNLISLSNATFTNNSTNTTISYQFEDSVTKTSETSFEMQLSEMVGASASVSVSADVLVVKVDTTVKAEWQRTSTQSSESSISTGIMLGWSLSGNLDARTAVVCRASCWQGVVTAPFTSWVVITFADPSVQPVAFGLTGIARNVLYSDATADVVSVTNLPAAIAKAS